MTTRSVKPSIIPDRAMGQIASRAKDPSIFSKIAEGVGKIGDSKIIKFAKR